MSGLAGILRFDGEPPSLEAVLAMSRSLMHRGPDDLGVELLGPLALAHRHLSSIEPRPAGRQPLASEDRSLWICLDGEIYNAQELQTELERRGHHFRAGTDGEVMLAAYRQWGDEAFARANGDWALSIWDQAARKLVLSRDRLGAKPLCYHRDPRRLLFASEAKALVSAQPSLAAPNLLAIARFLAAPSDTLGRDTFFAGVERLEPGTVLTIYQAGRSRSTRYWVFKPPVEAPAVSLEDAAEALGALLVDAVRRRLVPSTRVGAAVAGELEGTSLAAIAAICLGQRPTCFTVIDPGGGLEGERSAEHLREALQLAGRAARPTGADLPSVLECAATFTDLASADPGDYWQWQLMAQANGQVRRMLVPHGGRALYAGGPGDLTTYVRALALRGVKGHPGSWLDLLSVQPQLHRRAHGRLRRELLPSLRAKAQGIFRGSPFRHEPLPSPHLHRLLANGPEPESPAVTGDPLIDRRWDRLVRASLPPSLDALDRSSMAVGIEPRAPFLDYRLVEHAFRLPPAHLLGGTEPRRLLKRAVSRWVPKGALPREREEVSPPVMARWIRETHHAYFEALLLSSRASARGFVAAGAAERLLAEHRAGVRDHTGTLWRLASLELFCRRFFDAASD